MKYPLHKRALEYVLITIIYWAWYIPFLTPYFFFVINYTEEQYWIWFWSAIPFQLVLGYWTAKFVVRMEPFVRKRVGTYDPCVKCGRG